MRLNFGELDTIPAFVQTRALPIHGGGAGEMAQILVLHGPNLNLLGTREPEVYGRQTLAEIDAMLAARATRAGHALSSVQANAEHALVERIQSARDDGTAFILINPAAFTHTSVAILDALNTCEFPIVEVHISNVHKREAFRHHSYVSLRADGVIAGFGTQGYQLALRRLARLIDEKGT